MFPRADIAGIQPVGPIEPLRPAAPIGDARQEAFDRFSQLAVGRQFQAEVLTRLNDGSFVVKVADIPVRMNLPGGAQVGDALPLTLVAAQPRPTFLLGSQPAAAVAADTALSNAGRLIDQVLRAAQKEGAPTALVGKTPLVPSPAAAPAQVATALKDTLAFSGLFYESHVGQWASGERPLSDLLREPQAKNSNATLIAAALRAQSAGALPAPGAARPDADHHASPHLPAAAGDAHGAHPPAGQAQATAPASSAAAAFAAVSVAANAAPADAPTIPASGAGGMAIDMPVAVLSGADGPSASGDGTARAGALDGESVKMISLQLNTLEQQRVVWQGELWPGQPMEWEVTKDDTPHGHAGDAERSWQSVVRFELPTLGAVAASIRLAGGRLQVQVRAADEATASLLRNHGGELASALDAAGSPLDLLTVKRDESV